MCDKMKYSHHVQLQKLLNFGISLHIYLTHSYVQALLSLKKCNSTH